MVVQLKAVIYSNIKGLGRNLPKIRKEVFQDAGEYWFQKLFPDHFKPQARSEFQHESRTAKYLKSKRFRGVREGRFIDNILSGKTRRFLQEGPRITATSQGVTVRLDAPLYFRRQSAGQPDKVAEITNVSERHRSLMFRRMQGKTVTSIQSVLRQEPVKKV